MVLRFGSILALVAVAASCGGGGGGGARGGLSVAPSTSATTGAPGSRSTTQPFRGLDYTGVWEVAGVDSVQGAFSGTAVVTSTVQGLHVERLVTFAKKLPDGRDLLHAWNAVATKTSDGLAVVATLERADFYKSAGATKRTAADMQPTTVKLALKGANGAAPSNVIAGTKLDAGTETWTYSTASAPLFPQTDKKLLPLHSVDQTIRQTSFVAFSSFHTLPDVQPYVNRPEFQAAQHFAAVDHTAKAFYKARGRTAVVVLDKILDEVSIAEETPRADAFSLKLYEKAQRFDADVKNIHMRPCGMIAAVDTASGAHWVSGDGALWQGCYVESQAFRYVVTKDPEALANVEKATKALVALVEMSPNKSEFARAVDDNPPSSPNFVAGTGAYANMSWLPGGNNDMLHGIDIGFLAADLVLPAGHPLRASIGAAARSLLDNVSIAQSGTHSIFLSYVAWHMTGDPALKQRYEDAIGFKNLHIQAWITLGDGIMQAQGVSDWSGHHLAEVDLINLQLLGGTSPSLAESLWQNAAKNGAKSAFGNLSAAREGLLAVVAAAVNAPGAADVAKDVLEEIPCPKPTGVRAEIDLRIGRTFCVSPYPSAPWKFDWMTNPGRVQAIEGMGPYFRRGANDCYWKDGPLDMGGWVDNNRWVPQDYLHAYWFARLSGTLGPND